MNSSGFSLLELLIVIIIMSIVAVVGVGSWRDLQARSELSSVTRGVMQFLNAVKIDANLYNYNQSIYLLKKSEYDWCLVASEKNKPASCQTKFNFIPKTGFIELGGLKADAPLVFYGRRNSAKAATIRLKNKIGESRIIISLPGRIRYCSYDTYLAGFHQC
ncbi:prepilin-type N-terminal cleavage/methylation domain-containing protein [Orbus sturtevantii]|uniref:prepilin-type N-terminal cleavage/methylation domain-containing protein n=1 Tax=Orbus sturtevantii TaxID=3074109 RepID=UPI00370D0F65